MSQLPGPQDMMAQGQRAPVPVPLSMDQKMLACLERIEELLKNPPPVNYTGRRK
jgi:hypothetical protein